MNNAASGREPAFHVSRSLTRTGHRLYRFDIPAFPHMRVNSFLLVCGPPQQPSYSALIDVGSSFEISHAGLVSAFAQVGEQWGEAVTWAGLSRIVLTHAHPDHAAGMGRVRHLTAAPVAAHVDTALIVADPAAFRDRNLAQLPAALTWTGATGSLAERLTRRAGNLMVPEPISVDRQLNDGDQLDEVFEVIHTPGHAPGQLCLRVDDVLLSADQLLPRNLPPIFPERFQAGGGLRLYLDSLERLDQLRGVERAIGGHDGPMTQWRERVRQVQGRYAQKLADALASCDEPLTAEGLMRRLHPRHTDPQALLLLDQTASLLEYLLERGEVRERLGEGQVQFQRVQ